MIRSIIKIFASVLPGLISIYKKYKRKKNEKNRQNKRNETAQNPHNSFNNHFDSGGVYGEESDADKTK